ncbi:MAG: hypothetical protein FJY75_00050 [Candidatus Eisenbacteria bacterium]|uniref:Uncharacterized protein n=1 Tax=Eiseniibacteriota bacterium TaxID=2212470 RepID=A0A937X5H9_UNCEI|nr:hypothetical protein [Candidatus Eisenbacteria bacterium]
MRPESAQQAREEPAGLDWRTHPAAERRGVAAGVTLLMLAMAVLTGFWMGGAYWGVFAFLVLFLSLESFFLPTTYELRAAGIIVRKPFSRAERSWDAFRSAWCDGYGVTLSPFARRHWLESYRGIRLRLPARGGPGAEELRSWLRERLDPERVEFHGLKSEAGGARPAAGAGE